MSTWVTKLIDFLKLNEKPILTDAGKVSAEVGKQIALREFERFNANIQKETKKLEKFIEGRDMTDGKYKSELNKDSHINDTSFGKLSGVVGKADERGKNK